MRVGHGCGHEFFRTYIIRIFTESGRFRNHVEVLELESQRDDLLAQKPKDAMAASGKLSFE
jgi:hypothetical protein